VALISLVVRFLYVSLLTSWKDAKWSGKVNRGQNKVEKQKPVKEAAMRPTSRTVYSFLVSLLVLILWPILVPAQIVDFTGTVERKITISTIPVYLINVEQLNAEFTYKGKSILVFDLSSRSRCADSSRIFSVQPLLGDRVHIIAKVNYVGDTLGVSVACQPQMLARADQSSLTANLPRVSLQKLLATITENQTQKNSRTVSAQTVGPRPLDILPPEVIFIGTVISGSTQQFDARIEQVLSTTIGPITATEASVTWHGATVFCEGGGALVDQVSVGARVEVFGRVSGQVENFLVMGVACAPYYIRNLGGGGPQPPPAPPSPSQQVKFQGTVTDVSSRTGAGSVWVNVEESLLGPISVGQNLGVITLSGSDCSSGQMDSVQIGDKVEVYGQLTQQPAEIAVEACSSFSYYVKLIESNDWPNQPDPSNPLVIDQNGNVPSNLPEGGCVKLPDVVECKGRIDPGQDNDWMKVYLKQGQKFTARAFPFLTLDVKLVVKGPGVNTAANNYGPGFREEIQLQSSQAGIYDVGIQNVNGIDMEEWTLHLKIEEGQQPPTEESCTDKSLTGDFETQNPSAVNQIGLFRTVIADAVAFPRGVTVHEMEAEGINMGKAGTLFMAASLSKKCKAKGTGNFDIIWSYDVKPLAVDLDTFTIFGVNIADAAARGIVAVEIVDETTDQTVDFYFDELFNWSKSPTLGQVVWESVQLALGAALKALKGLKAIKDSLKVISIFKRYYSFNKALYQWAEGPTSVSQSRYAALRNVHLEEGHTYSLNYAVMVTADARSYVPAAKAFVKVHLITELKNVSIVPPQGGPQSPGYIPYPGKDADKDGILDSRDKCVSKPGNSPSGCPVVIPSQVDAAIGNLLPGDPSGVDTPEMVIGTNELLRAVDAWNRQESLSGVGNLDKESLIEIALRWLLDLPINVELPLNLRDEMKVLVGQQQSGTSIFRKLSTSKVRPGGSFDVTIDVSTEEDADILVLVDIPPKDWQVHGENFTIMQNIKRREKRNLTYKVIVPQSASGIYDFVGIASSVPESREIIHGDSNIEVVSGSDVSRSVEEAIVGPDFVVSDEEFFKALDYWVTGTVVAGTGAQILTDSLFFHILDIWASGTPIHTRSFKNSKIRKLSVQNARFITSTAGNISGIFEVRGIDIAAMRIEAFDLRGTQLFAQEVVGNRLRFQAINKYGTRLANGVYLYALTVKGHDGTIYRLPVKKFVLVR